MALAGTAHQKPKHQAGNDIIGLDIGPSTLAVVPRAREAHLLTFCEALTPNAGRRRRLQRKMERQRRANNPEHYDEKGAHQASWQKACALEGEQALSGLQTPTRIRRKETGSPSQESAWEARPRYSAYGQDHSH